MLPTTSPITALLALPPIAAIVTCACLLVLGVPPRLAGGIGGIVGVLFVAAVAAVLS